MITKNIIKYLAASFVCIGLSAAFTSCSSDEDPFFTANEDDAPRIINTDLPEGKGGEPAELPSIERTANFTSSPTPSVSTDANGFCVKISRSV